MHRPKQTLTSSTMLRWCCCCCCSLLPLLLLTTKTITAAATTTTDSTSTASSDDESSSLQSGPWGPWNCNCAAGSMSRARLVAVAPGSERPSEDVLGLAGYQRVPCNAHECRCSNGEGDCAAMRECKLGTAWKCARDEVKTAGAARGGAGGAAAGAGRNAVAGFFGKVAGFFHRPKGKQG
ncbi:protein MENT [Petromyzon marinus]|uniref:protein MENT n=1 Tax=Petromyzon marinus TaxID=7757 RepID=UPI003F709488